MAITEGNPPAQPFRGNLYRASAESAAWLSHCTEAVREPELRLVDAHHHLWSDERGRYELAEMGRDVRGSNVVGTVYVECGSGYEASVDYGAFGQTDVAPYLRAVAETEYVVHAVRDAGAAGFGACRGIVGFANLLLGPGVRAVLEAQIEAGDGRFRGIRQSAGWDAALGEMVGLSNQIGIAQKKIRAHAEQIAVQLVDLVEASIKVTGETKQTSLENWARVILKRALEMVG